MRCDDAPHERAGAERREEVADDLGIGPIAAEDEHGQRGNETLCHEVHHGRSTKSRPEQLVVDQVPNAGEETARRIILGDALPGADEDEDDEEREDVGRRIDQEHFRRADPRDQQAAEVCRVVRRAASAA